MVITSLENQKIKNLTKLQKKKYRDLTNTYVIEGEHLVTEAYKRGLVLEVFVLDGESCTYDVTCTYVSLAVMKKISTMDSVSPIIAICQKMNYTDIHGNKVLLLDDIQDPGNLGTIIRSSVAFGIDMIILSENTVDLYNNKVLRSTQGMYCMIPILSMNSIKAISILRERGYIIYGTNVVDGVDVRNLQVPDKFCLVMGNEGNGVSSDIQKLCHQNLYISMNSQVESLNVGVACSILLYELGR